MKSAEWLEYADGPPRDVLDKFDRELADFRTDFDTARRIVRLLHDASEGRLRFESLRIHQAACAALADELSAQWEPVTP